MLGTKARSGCFTSTQMTELIVENIQGFLQKRSSRSPLLLMNHDGGQSSERLSVFLSFGSQLFPNCLLLPIVFLCFGPITAISSHVAEITHTGSNIEAARG